MVRWEDVLGTSDLLAWLFERHFLICFIHGTLEQCRGMLWCGQCQLNEYFLEGKKGKRVKHREGEREQEVGSRRRGQKSVFLYCPWMTCNPDLAFP